MGPSKLKEVIELVIENSPASIAVLKQRHNMHTLAGKWQGRNECHVANAGAFFEHTGSHDELFGT